MREYISYTCCETPSLIDDFGHSKRTDFIKNEDDKNNKDNDKDEEKDDDDDEDDEDSFFG